MFKHIPSPIRKRMQALEEIDSRDRQEGFPTHQRLRQIPAVTGKFLAIMASNAPEGGVIELGTSAGYSTLWLILASKIRGDMVTTYEVLEEKIAIARETFEAAEVNQLVNLVHADGRDCIQNHSEIAFCFLDAEKDIYSSCYELLIPKLVSGGLFLADNAVSHAHILEEFLEHVRDDDRVDSMVVPIGKGILLCRKE